MKTGTSHLNLFGVKSRKEGIVVAVQAYGNGNVKKYYIRIAFKRVSFMILKTHLRLSLT